MKNVTIRTGVKSLIVVAVTLGNVQAGSVMGTGGGTEVTQILNNLQLIMSYEQLVSSYVRQGLQLEAELKNLIANPTSALGSDVGQLINTIGQMMSAGQSIGYNLAQIDKNFSTLYQSKPAGTLAQAFTTWHQTNTDTFQGVLRSIGASRDQYSSNQAALTDLYNRSQATNGTLDSLQTLSQINIKQIQQLQSLQELMANQATAETTYMATQTAKDQKRVDDATKLAQPYTVDIPPDRTAPAPKWNGFNK